MKLVYMRPIDTDAHEVRAHEYLVTIGDKVFIGKDTATVSFFRKPSHPGNGGKISVDLEDGSSREYYVSVIGAEWVEREDREQPQRVQKLDAVTDEQVAAMVIDYDSAPNGLGESFRRYIEMRCPVGGFLTAVLENDLKGACGRADQYNRAALADIVQWLYNKAPSGCWGSTDRVSQWLAKRDVKGGAK